MITIGDSSKFSINWDITDIVDNWVFGHFYWKFGQNIVGNCVDCSVDLKGCFSWVKNFIDNPKNRYEPNLYELDKNEIYLRLASSILVNDENYGLIDEVYENTFSRFHISHIGMSSFDIVTILLITNEKGDERCIWKASKGEIMEAFLRPYEIEGVFLEFINSFQNTISMRSTD